MSRCTNPYAYDCPLSNEQIERFMVVRETVKSMGAESAAVRNGWTYKDFMFLIGIIERAFPTIPANFEPLPPKDQP